MKFNVTSNLFGETEVTLHRETKAKIAKIGYFVVLGTASVVAGLYLRHEFQIDFPSK